MSRWRSSWRVLTMVYMSGNKREIIRAAKLMFNENMEDKWHGSKRICQWCGKAFCSAKTTTNYCSPQCSKRLQTPHERAGEMELRQIQEMVEVKKKLESQGILHIFPKRPNWWVSPVSIFLGWWKRTNSVLPGWVRMSLIRRADIELMLKTKPYESIKPKDDVDITDTILPKAWCGEVQR